MNRNDGVNREEGVKSRTDPKRALSRSATRVALEGKPKVSR